MRFLKADVDLRLLALILIMLLAFAGFSVYYQNKIGEMQREYNRKLENLKETEEKLLLKEKRLNEISELKEALKKDKETLEIGYLSLQSENQMIERSIIENSQQLPFGKVKCKAIGNVQCFS